MLNIFKYTQILFVFFIPYIITLNKYVNNDRDDAIVLIITVGV